MSRGILILAVLLSAGGCGPHSIGGKASNKDPNCVPQTCASLGKNCGDVLDGCGNILRCGDGCGAGEACGAGGEANVCAPGTCTPKTCAALGANCGSVSDGCGSILTCGLCQAPEVCGARAMPNVCGSVTCLMPCPSGSTCDKGVCVGADLSSLSLEAGPAVRVSFSPIIGASAYCSLTRAVVILRNESTGALSRPAVVPCTVPSGNDPLVSTVVSAGTYEVWVYPPDPNDRVPGTSTPTYHYQAMAGVAVSSDITLTLANPTVSVGGNVVLSTGGYATQCKETLVFRSKTSHTVAKTTLGCTTGVFSLSLTPDTYDVFVEDFGRRPLFHSPTPLVVTGAQANLTIPMEPTLFGSVTRNGTVMSAPCEGRLDFVSEEDPSRVAGSAKLSCETGNWRYGLVLPSGKYKVIYMPALSSTLFPDASWIATSSLAVTGANQTQNFDIPVTSLTGTVTVSGAPGSATESSPPSVGLGNEEVSNWAQVTVSPSGWTYSGLFYPGTYSTLFVSGNTAVRFPFGEFPAKAINLTVSGLTQTVNLDIPLRRVTGKLLRDGGPMGFPCNSTPATTLILELGRASVNCSTADWTYVAYVYAGSQNATLFSNPNTFNTAVNFDATTLDIDFPSPQPPQTPPLAQVMIEVRRNGQPLTSICGAGPAIELLGANGDKRRSGLTCSNDGWYSNPSVLPDVAYRPRLLALNNPALPNFPYAPPGKVVTATLQTPARLTLDVPVATISGLVHVNGQVPQSMCETGSNLLRFLNVATSEVTTITLPCDTGAWDFSGVFFPGVYQVEMSGDGVTTPGHKSILLIDRLDVRP